MARKIKWVIYGFFFVLETVIWTLGWWGVNHGDTKENSGVLEKIYLMNE